jgi:signal peptidase I
MWPNRPKKPPGRHAASHPLMARRAGRARRRPVVAAVQLALLAAVLVLCWPTSLGGSVSFIEVSGHSMLPAYRTGDLLVTRSQSTYRVGDPIVYLIPRGDVGAGQRVVHRIIGGDGRDGYQMRGDNNSFADPWHPRDTDVVGRVVLHIPSAGEALALLSRPLNVGIFCGSVTVTCLLWPREVSSRRRRSPTSGRRAAAGGRAPPP